MQTLISSKCDNQWIKIPLINQTLQPKWAYCEIPKEKEQPGLEKSGMRLS